MIKSWITHTPIMQLINNAFIENFKSGACSNPVGASESFYFRQAAETETGTL
jgi:hypothetical protein